MSINWHNIRTLSGSQNEGFEELVCQLARNEITDGDRFIRKGKPDAGVECYWICNDGSEIAWQAKFFTSSLESSQWNQIDRSVLTALEKHSNLKRYVVAMPIDPSDGRLEGQQSLLSKWEERCIKWRKQAAEKGLDVAFEAWWSSDLLSRLSKPENEGLVYFWFNKQEFFDRWFTEQNNSQIKDLGPRYIVNSEEHLNVKLSISEGFIGLLRGEKFKGKIDLELKSLFEKLKLVEREFNSESMESLALKFNDIKVVLDDININEIDNIQIDPVIDILEEIEELLEKLGCELQGLFEAEGESKSSLNYKSYKLNELRDGVYEFSSFINSTLVVLANKPYLLITGDAGMGKSHLLADIVRKRQEQGAFSLFLLGQKFVTQEEPWMQIKRHLDLSCSKNEFFGALNSKAQASRKRLVIFIDALNEGQGKYFWQDSLRSFVSEIQKYPWLGLVLSVRTTYEKVIVPDGLVINNAFLKIEHKGFIENSFKAAEDFFKNFGITAPSIPLLHPEFTNPLFLLLFCQGLNRAGCSTVPKGMNGITKIFFSFINNTNQLLSAPNRFNYAEHQNLVSKSIDLLIKKKIESPRSFVTYEEYLLALNKMLNPYGVVAAHFLEALISEGVLTKNIFWNETNGESLEGIYLAYERLEEHVSAKYLIEAMDNIDAAFEEGGVFYNYFKDSWSCQINKGLLEALSIQIPENTGNELFTYLPLVSNSIPVVESFIQSLLWRDIKSLEESTLHYINSVIFSNQETEDLFFDALISISLLPQHALNAEFLHKKLMRQKLPERDSLWATYLYRACNYYEENSVLRLVNWAWECSDGNSFDNKSIGFAATTLSWFLASTFITLRNKATKSLVVLLKDNVDILINVLKKFEKVDDPYVYERLFAAAYGVAVLTKDYDGLQRLAEYVYATIFDTESEIYPHFLLRDYARGVVEYAYSEIEDFYVDIERCRPPYRSCFPSSFPTNDEIDEKYQIDYGTNKDKRFLSQNYILNSMTTEYGRGLCGYGDFGRYTFQSALRDWDVSPDKLSNLAVEWIFEKYGFDAALHGDFDLNLGTGRSRKHQAERIGKKYQWLALHEMLARVSDNCSMKEPYSWDEEIELADFGPWQTNRRDIDPTFISKEPSVTFDEIGYRYEEYGYWSVHDWIKSEQDLPKPEDLILFVDSNNQDWLALEAHLDWGQLSEQSNNHYGLSGKKIWYQIRSYLIKNTDLKEFEAWSEQQDFTVRWMPESYGNHTVFDREFYWSSAYFSYADDVQGLPIRTQHGARSYNGKVTLTTDYYRWEDRIEDFDAGADFLRPSLCIFNGLNLKRTDSPFKYLDQDARLSVFSATSEDGGSSDEVLFVNKQQLESFLTENNLTVIWTVLGEKQDFDATEPDARLLELNGVYMLKNGGVKGRIKTNII